MLPTITLGPLTIDMYTSMIGVAAVGMLVYVLTRRRKVELSVLQSIIFVLLFTILGVIEVMILAFLENFEFGGKEIFGAVYLIPLVMPVIGRCFKLTTQQSLDMSALCIAITAGAVKIGCFFAGCCEGVVLYLGTTWFQWPAQIVGSIAGCILVVWLLRIEASGNNRGAMYPLFMLSYGLIRFTLDSLEYMPDRWFGLRHSQCFGLISAAIGIIWLVICKKRISQKGPSV